MRKSKLLLVLSLIYVLLSIAGLIALMLLWRNIIIIIAYLCVVVCGALLFCALFAMEEKIDQNRRNTDNFRIRMNKLDLSFSKLELKYAELEGKYKSVEK